MVFGYMGKTSIYEGSGLYKKIKDVGIINPGIHWGNTGDTGFFIRDIQIPAIQNGHASAVGAGSIFVFQGRKKGVLINDRYSIIEKIGHCVAQPKLDGFRLQIYVLI